jgi:peptidylglycine monooxygenase
MVRTELTVVLGERLYAVERPWGDLPAGMQLSYVSDVAVDAQGAVYVVQRSDPPVVVFEPNGAYRGGWGGELIADAHGIAATPDGRLLIVDRDAHQVLVCDTAGNLLQALGERHRPRLKQPFNHPTDAAAAPNGDIYVADGYGNSAVHRFAADGTWLATWGTPGSGPGRFTTPHAVRVTADPSTGSGQARVLVADRENNRVQVFSPDGEYLAEWPDLYHPMDIYVAPDGLVYVTDQIPRLTAFAADGTLVGRCRPVLYGAHGIWGAPDGSLFLAEASPMNRLTRLVPLGKG